MPPLQTQRHGKRRVPNEASLFSKDPDPSGLRRVYFLPPFNTKQIPVHVPAVLPAVTWQQAVGNININNSA